MVKKLLIYISVLLFLMPCVASAQRKEDGARSQWLTEMRQYKRNYFAKELGLTREQQNKFFPLYEEMDDETYRIEEEARQMEKRVSEMADPSDTEFEKATEALYDARLRTAQIEKDYLEKFNDILSRKQLFQLKAVERKFQRDMMRQHHRLRQNAKGRKAGR